MPPRQSSSVLPCKVSCIPILECRDCQPSLELYDVTKKPSLIATFGVQAKQQSLSPDREYRILFIDEHLDASWKYSLTIGYDSDQGHRVLMSVEEEGVGQVAIRREISFADAWD